MTTEERALRLENAFATLSEMAANVQSNAEKLTGLVAQEKARISDLEKHFKMLTEIAVRADERLNGHDGALNNLTAKMEALADAQIKTEESLARTNEALESLAARVDHLSETVERFINERHGSS